VNNNLLNAVRRVVSEQGEGILAYPARLKGFISDYAKNEPVGERLAFGRCIEGDYYAQFKNTRTEAERRQLKAMLLPHLQKASGQSAEICQNTLDLLEAVLYPNAAAPLNTPFPTSQTPFTAPQQNYAQQQSNYSPQQQNYAPQQPSYAPSYPTKLNHSNRNILIAVAAVVVVVVLIVITISVQDTLDTSGTPEERAQKHYDRAITLHNAGNYNGAIKEYTKSIELEPQNAFAYIMRGTAYGMKYDFYRAIQDFEKAIVIGANDQGIKDALEEARKLIEW
jgi:tetratricopeptide (TPR) repeat protein